MHAMQVMLSVSICRRLHPWRYEVFPRWSAKIAKVICARRGMMLTGVRCIA